MKVLGKVTRNNAKVFKRQFKLTSLVFNTKITASWAINFLYLASQKLKSFSNNTGLERNMSN